MDQLDNINGVAAYKNAKVEGRNKSECIEAFFKAEPDAMADALKKNEIINGAAPLVKLFFPDIEQFKADDRTMGIAIHLYRTHGIKYGIVEAVLGKFLGMWFDQEFALRIRDIKAPPFPLPKVDVAKILLDEEVKYQAMLKRAPGIVKKVLADGVSGEKLAYLHHTHGCDIFMAEDALGKCFNTEIHEAYQNALQNHKNKSNGPT